MTRARHDEPDDGDRGDRGDAREQCERDRQHIDRLPHAAGRHGGRLDFVDQRSGIIADGLTQDLDKAGNTRGSVVQPHDHTSK